ncbi:MAG: phenylalanine--tRNA ligase subunit beta [Clostridiales bacterium]|nr:phenylalanine--tRNA ligase subunit beta [Clostridiales bacterium]
MNISLKFLERYVDLPQDLTYEQIAYDLTMRTVEVENIVNTADKFHDIVVGEIKEIKPHPNADALKICMTDVGEGDLKQIVCGGSNLQEGHKVCVSKPGAEVVWHGEGEPVLIKESKLRGEKSYGMICGATEVFLGDIYPPADEREIVDFTDLGVECEVGQCVAEVAGLDDIILEVDNKSLSNRPDLWGHLGVARELAAIYKLPLKDYPTELPKGLPEYPVEILEPERCPRFTATIIDNIYVKESPAWMKTLITNGGMRPINAIVDITNFVLMAVGQPQHAYDSTHVEGGKIVVRLARDGEKLLLLDEKDLDLTSDHLVICDTVEPMNLAGIKGGKKDSVLDTTTSIVLEAAVFTAPGIRRTTAYFNEKTDAALRYEKGIDTQRTDLGVALALELFKEIYPECRISAFSDVYPVKTENAVIDITQDFLDRRLGEVISTEEIEDILVRLGYKVEFSDGVYHCTAPTWRSTGDVSIHDDILGDIARLIGYEYFKKRPLTIAFDSSVNQVRTDLNRRLREYLAFRCGFNEIFTYPWIDEKFIHAAKIDTDASIRLATPPAPELGILRSSLIPGMLESIDKNYRYFDEFSMFEAAQVFEKGEYSPSSPEEVLPVHRNYLSGTIVGKDARTDFFKVKGVIEGMAGYCHFEPLSFKQKAKPSWADEKVWLNVMSGKTVVGSIGLISVAALAESGIKMVNAAAFELDVDKLVPYPSRTNEFEHLPQYPLVEQDLSLLVDESVTWEDIRESIKYMVKSLKFVEEYRGKQIPAGKKSVMLSLTIGNDDSTMTSKQIEKKMNGIIKVLGKKCNAELR